MSEISNAVQNQLFVFAGEVGLLLGLFENRAPIMQGLIINFPLKLLKLAGSVGTSHAVTVVGEIAQRDLGS